MATKTTLSSSPVSWNAQSLLPKEEPLLLCPALYTGTDSVAPPHAPYAKLLQTIREQNERDRESLAKGLTLSGTISSTPPTFTTSVSF